ncbi:uncharacterized protein [Drosophila takahashii]|uniref:uncharacterized protein n=1 Tax=Drosophila takahashii TaxID=29030 RepID=UPI00389957A7
MSFGYKNIQSVVIIVILCVIMEITSHVEFTNVKCTSSDVKFVNYEVCRLKSVNRTYKYVSVKSRLYKLPITNATINISLFKRLNGYKPFLYNVSVDACRFLQIQKSNPVVKYLFNLFLTHSNVKNPSCPFSLSYVTVDKLTTNFLNNQFSKVLPVPEGDYLFVFKWFSDNIYRSSVNVYSTIS